MSNNYNYTVLCEVKTHKIEYKGEPYVKGDYVLIPRPHAVQYGKAVRILTRTEQLQKEKEWKDADNKT